MKRLLRDQSCASVFLISFTSMVLLSFMAWTPTAHGGACCVVEGTKIIDIECVDVSSINDCDAIGGAYWGDDVSCDVRPCILNEVTGACCLPSGGCKIMTPQQCLNEGGQYKGGDSCNVRCYPLTGETKSIPAMNHWGLLIFVILLILSYVWFIRRRRKYHRGGDQQDP